MENNNTSNIYGGYLVVYQMNIMDIEPMDLDKVKEEYNFNNVWWDVVGRGGMGCEGDGWRWQEVIWKIHNMVLIIWINSGLVLEIGVENQTGSTY